MKCFFLAMLGVAMTLAISPVVKASRNFASGSSQYAALQSAAVTGYPATVATWYNPNSTGAAYAIVIVQDKTGTARFGLFGLTGGSIQIDVIPTNSGSGFNTISPLGYSSNTWTHICGVWESSTSRKLYVNGVPVATNTVSAPMSPSAAFNATYVGTRGSLGTLGTFLNGQVAQVAIWNVALTDGQVASLASGVDPRRASSTPPTFYAPLWGEASPEINVVGTAISLTNSPTKGSSDPRIYRP